MELMQASRQWASRPDDERFTSLHALHSFVTEQREHSKAIIVSSRRLEAKPTSNSIDAGLEIYGPNGHGYTPSHYAFGQLASLVKAPAGYLRNLPAPMAADCLNYGLQSRDVEDVGVLIRRNGSSDFAAATGPNYGRIWNAEITGNLVRRFGDGISGDWRVPGEFGQAVQVTKANTTLYASDRDMFVFLADEVNRVEVPNRRDGKSGQMARGFFVWNSEVGSSVFGFAQFLFDYACCNRIVWGAREFKELRIRHTSGGPDRFAEEIPGTLRAISNSSVAPIVDTIQAAKEARVEKLNDFLAKRNFASTMAAKVSEAHKQDEGRPVESVWDVVTGLTAYARTIPHQDERVKLEREAGKLLDLVAN